MDSGKVVRPHSVGSKRHRNDSQKKKEKEKEKENESRRDNDLEGYWYCRRCFSFNAASRFLCRNGYPVPEPTTVSGRLSERALPDNRASGKHHGGPNGLSEGDWICSTCDYLNFSFRTICNRSYCRARRPTHVTEGGCSEGALHECGCGSLSPSDIPFIPDPNYKAYMEALGPFDPEKSFKVPGLPEPKPRKWNCHFCSTENSPSRTKCKCKPCGIRRLVI